MQNNRGNFGWLSRSSNSLAEEQRIMVERQQEMIRNLNVNQRLTSLSSQQQIPSLFSSLPMLASVNNVVPNQLSNLMLPGSLLSTNSLLSNSNMAPAPSMVPTPRAQSPTISDSGRLKKSLYNDSRSRFFSSRNINEEKPLSSSLRQSKFEDTKVDARSWDDEKWGQLGKGLIRDKPSSSKNRPEQRNFLNRTADQKDRGASHRSNDSQSSRKWEDLGKTIKPFINPWANESETEPSRGWNQERSDLARDDDNSWSLKSLEERGSRMDTKSFEEHQRINRARPNDVQLTSDKRESEPDQRRALEHQSWSSKSNQNEQSKWNDSQRKYNDFRGIQVQEDRGHIWGSPKLKDDNLRSKERTVERLRSVNPFDLREESSWAKRSGEEPEHDHHVKKAKMQDEKWFINSNRPETLNWNTKPVEPKEVWSESSNVERNENWLSNSRESDKNIWKPKLDNVWTDKSKTSESESWSKRPVETDMRRSNTWNSRSQSDDQKLPLRDLGLKVWDEKPRNPPEHIWSRNKGEDVEPGESLNRNRLGQNRSSSENKASTSRQSRLRDENPDEKQSRFVDEKLRPRKSRFDNDDPLKRQNQFSDGSSLTRQSRFSDDSSRPRHSRFSEDVPVARQSGVKDENKMGANVKDKDKNVLSNNRDNNLPTPPSNFLYPDPCKRSLSSDVWSRLDSRTGEKTVSGTDTPMRFEENKRIQVVRDELDIRANSGNDGDWEEAARDDRIASIVQAGLAERVGYLDSQLEQLDQRMLQIYNTSSMMAAKETQLQIPTLWEACGTPDLRVTLQKKAEANMAEINIASINASQAVTSSLGGWTEDMVLIYPFMRHSSLSHVDISDLKSLLSKRIHSLLSSNPQNIQPRFLRSDYVNKGWFVVQCADEQSMNWLLKWKPTLTTKKRMNLCVRRAVDAVRVAHIEIYLPGVKEPIKEIESRIHAQNEHLETYLWRRALHNPGRSGTTIGFLVDNACLKLLETNSWRIYYELTKASVKVLKHKPVPPMFQKRKG